MSVERNVASTFLSPFYFRMCYALLCITGMFLLWRCCQVEKYRPNRSKFQPLFSTFLGRCAPVRERVVRSLFVIFIGSSGAFVAPRRLVIGRCLDKRRALNSYFGGTPIVCVLVLMIGRIWMPSAESCAAFTTDPGLQLIDQ